MNRQSIDAVFHPERPVADPSQLVGRNEEVQLTVDRLSTSGGHVLLYGHRGIGKTSIAQVADVTLRKDHPHLLVRSMSCDVQTDFLSIAATCLEGTAHAENREVHRSPVRVADLVFDRRGFLIIDELDRLGKNERSLLGDFLKRLSDRGASFSVCAVGIAQTAAELFSGHPSVSRCLNEIDVQRLPERRLAEIVEIGFITLHQRVRVDVVEDIARLSLGFPSNTVLICRYIAEGAIRAPTGMIGPEELRRGLLRLLSERGRSTADLLSYLAHSPRGALKRSVLLAGTMLKLEEFTTDQLFDATRDQCSIERKVFENLWVGMCMDGPEYAFDNVRPSVIRFRDPRFPLMLLVSEFVARLDGNAATQ